MHSLTHHTVLVTGGAGDLLRATARMVLLHGGRVSLFDASSDALERTRRELEPVIRLDWIQDAPPGPRVHCVVGDASQEAAVRRAFDETERTLGPVTALVNGVGIFRAVPIVSLEAAEWDRLMAVNLRSVFLASREALRRWGDTRPGNIVSIASLAGQVGGIVAGADYAASKAGVISLTRSLAKQVAGKRIRVNCVNPGIIESRMTREDFPAGRLDDLVQEIPMRRLGTPEDVARVVYFLLSELSAYVHGAQIDVNGGVRVG